MITFACTIFNEESNIKKFLQSIVSQSIPPNKIIIVDGGSIDNTVRIINSFKKKSKIPIKLIISKGANIAKGRNLYMQEVKEGFLFSGDASTRFEKDWIKKLLEGFEEGADIVFGVYQPEEPKNIFEKIVNTRVRDYSKYTEEDWKREIPSNRQTAYRVSSWKKAGLVFPEWMDRADDSWVYDKAIQKGLKFRLIKDAKVFWHPRSGLKEYLKLAYLDSLSEGLSGIVWKRKSYYLAFSSLVILIVSLILAITISLLSLLAWPVLLGGIYLLEGIKIFNKTKEIKCFLLGGAIMILSFFAHALGGIIGIIKRPFVKKSRN
ncbi:MAG: glycosyltransferase [Candidatus Gastranaerophilales bacterium]|nr:glycosyltransferase [Candidatus Gastranaerophilales bacterium]